MQQRNLQVDVVAARSLYNLINDIQYIFSLRNSDYLARLRSADARSLARYDAVCSVTLRTIFYFYDRGKTVIKRND